MSGSFLPVAGALAGVVLVSSVLSTSIQTPVAAALVAEQPPMQPVQAERQTPPTLENFDAGCSECDAHSYGGDYAEHYGDYDEGESDSDGESDGYDGESYVTDKSSFVEDGAEEDESYTGDLREDYTDYEDEGSDYYGGSEEDDYEEDDYEEDDYEEDDYEEDEEEVERFTQQPVSRRSFSIDANGNPVERFQTLEKVPAVKAADDDNGGIMPYDGHEFAGVMAVA